MAATAAAEAAEQQCYTNDNWQAQLEEVLALQSIFAEEFRCVRHGRKTTHGFYMYASRLLHASLHSACLQDVPQLSGTAAAMRSSCHAWSSA
jgi:hypothetical protein